MSEAYICDAVRTPIGRYAGALAGVRADDLGAIPLRAILERNAGLDEGVVEEIVFGCANQAGEDNRNVARMSALLAGFPVTTPAMTVNRLCGSGMEAVASVARAIKCGELGLGIAGGVESMSRAPFVLPKSEQGFSRNMEVYDTTIGWRFVNPLMKAQYGVDSMPETAENVAVQYGVGREDQDAFALRSQERYADARARGAFDREIVPVMVERRKQPALIVDSDEHPRATTLEKLAQLRPLFGEGGTVTAGNASGVNDGAAAILLASGAMVDRQHLRPLARIVAFASAGVEPRVMGIGPVPAVNKALALAGLSIEDMDLIELNEAFASQGIAVLRELGVKDDAEHVNPNGGAIALGHPLGMSGARIVGTAAHYLQAHNLRYALCTMCVGVGQGVAMVLERV
ncbi:3-oxoadipyl-CoA thiolase [Hahella sp. KA22]|uniref:3-oxoadipyl-CoA thiolase n=1 Tax=Hahella sp. KA22 TaxID=1628392 RepID=UPI000FDEE772|nr:3-oxoadipyl-CoA thiolase [Hahella sp. KA22]AZZ90133.1 3-oxoadipyl-CoA thiolase [Hahella sp. KA22]QAY53503.1 3-oxoadipyl-CoA thiolase [Hahella sp. KA22]